MGTEADTIRAFVAVELPDSVKTHLEEVQRQLKRLEATSILRWVDPRLSHITLKFLGNVEVARLADVSQALDQVACSIEPFTVALGELGVFPNIYRPRVLWLGVSDPQGHFRRLARAVDRAMEALGFEPEMRGPFVPHITLGRVGRRATAGQRKALGNIVGQVEVSTGHVLQVDHIVLMRSVLAPSGPIYTRLSYHHLGTANAGAGATREAETPPHERS